MTERSLLLLRHAKSSWDDPSLVDFDRPLAKRGREAAPRIAREMVLRGWRPDHAIVSPALRTRQTWDLVAEMLPGSIPHDFVPTIYEAPAKRILEAVRAAPEHAKCLLVVGHNPGMEELAASLIGPGSDAQAKTRMRKKFPTAALAVFEGEFEWRELGPGGARLIAFVRPTNLE